MVFLSLLDKLWLYSQCLTFHYLTIGKIRVSSFYLESWILMSWLSQQLFNVFEQILFVSILSSFFGCFQEKCCHATSYPIVTGCRNWCEAILNRYIGRACVLGVGLLDARYVCGRTKDKKHSWSMFMFFYLSLFWEKQCLYLHFRPLLQNHEEENMSVYSQVLIGIISALWSFLRLFDGFAQNHIFVNIQLVLKTNVYSTHCL